MSGDVFLGFEDNLSASSDMDYNDVVISIRSTCTLDITHIPCYSTCDHPAQVCIRALRISRA